MSQPRTKHRFSITLDCVEPVTREDAKYHIEYAFFTADMEHSNYDQDTLTIHIDGGDPVIEHAR